MNILKASPSGPLLIETPTTNGVLTWDGSKWVCTVPAGGGPPTGPAGGCLDGTYPNPNVVAIQETGGPAVLPVGAIPDGSTIIRVGTDIVGLYRDAAQFGTTLGAVADGEQAIIGQSYPATPIASVTIAANRLVLAAGLYAVSWAIDCTAPLALTMAINYQPAGYNGVVAKSEIAASTRLSCAGNVLSTGGGFNLGFTLTATPDAAIVESVIGIQRIG